MAHVFTAEERLRATQSRLANRDKRKSKRDGAITAELAVSLSLRFLVDTIQNENAPPYVRNGAARTILTALHDAGVRPSQRDLAVIFRKLAGPEVRQREANAADANERERAASDSDAPARDATEEERSAK